MEALSTLCTTADIGGTPFLLNSLFVSCSAFLKELTKYPLIIKITKLVLTALQKHFLPSLTILVFHGGR